MGKLTARWVQKEILEKHSTSGVRVYAVWFSMLPSDARSRWRLTNPLRDPRVTHLWDEDKIMGNWYADHVDDYPGVVRDKYYLYGPAAHWDLTPAPLVSSGRTVFATREELRTSLLPLLNANPR